MLDSARLQKLGELLGLFDGNGADKHGLSLFVALLNPVADSVQLSVDVLVYSVVVVHADYGLVGGNLDYVQLVNLTELVLLGHSRTRHTRELFVQTEEVLERDGRKGLAFVVDFYALFCLYRLVKSRIIAASEHQTSRKFVNDDDLAVLDDIIHIALHNSVCADRLVDVVEQGHIVGIHKVFDIEVLLRLGNTTRQKVTGFLLFIHKIVAVKILLVFLFGIDFHDFIHFEGFRELIRLLVQIGGFVALTRNDERGSRLVYQDGVHLVHDREIRFALNEVLFVDAHIIAQIVESKLVVGRVGDVARVSGAALVVIQLVGDKPDSQPKEAVDFAHPLAVALGEVVVYRNDMNAIARQRVKVRRESRHKGFTLTGLHFGDSALMKYDSADDLYGVVLDSDYAR